MDNKQKLMSFNVNLKVYVKLTDKGIEKIVRDTNLIMPFKLQVSFKEIEDASEEEKNKEN